MGFRNPVTSVSALDTGQGFAVGSVQTYTDNPTGPLGTPLHTAAGFSFRDGITGDAPALLVNEAFYTAQGNNSLTEQGGGLILAAGSYNGVTGPELDLNVESIPGGGGFGPVARLIAGPNGQVVMDGLLSLVHDPAWASFAPNWKAAGSAPSVGNGSLIARSRQLGRLVFVSYFLTFGSTTSGGTGIWTFGLPVPAAPGREHYLGVKGFTTAGNFVGEAYISGGSDVVNPHLPASTSNCSLLQVQNVNTAGTANSGVPAPAAGQPYPFTTGANLALWGCYEAAQSP